MLFEFAPFHSCLFAPVVSELRELCAEAVINLPMGVPELPFGFVLSRGFEVKEDIVLAGAAIPNGSAICFLPSRKTLIL